MLRWAHLLTGTALLALALAAPAGAETVLGFDDLTSGATVTTQYQSRGVTFGSAAPGQGQTTANVPVVSTEGVTLAPSGSHVGKVSRRCLTSECVGTTEVWAELNLGLATHVAVSVGAYGTASNTITLTAFDRNGGAVGSQSVTVTGGQGFRSRLSVTSLKPTIAYIRVRGSTAGTIGIDDVTHNVTAGAPDFAVRSRSGSALTVTEGTSTGVDLIVDRANFCGAIRLSASSLPAGVTMAPVDLAASCVHQLVRVTFTASQTAQPANARQLTITGTPVQPPPGLTARSTTLSLTSVAFYDARVQGIEVTQGIQTLGLPFTDTATPSIKTYSGVSLEESGRTIVRVYVDNARFFLPFGLVSGVSVRLSGINVATGAALPGSPLLPDGGSGGILAGSSVTPTDAERTNAGAAFTFTLPPGWSGPQRAASDFIIALRAELVLPVSPALVQCSAASCQDNDRQTLAGVRFTATCCVKVTPVLLHADGYADPPPPSTLLPQVLNLIPLELDVPAQYAATIDISDLVNAEVAAAKRGETDCYGSVPPNPPGPAVLARCFDPSDLMVSGVEQQGVDPGQVLIGIWSKELGVLGQGSTGFVHVGVTPDRPFTGFGHEVHHGFRGPGHISSVCGGGGVDWPPDEIGLIHGIALDRTVASPYRVFATPAGVPSMVGQPDSRGFYDLMSYCALDGVPDEWISSEGWNDLIARRDAIKQQNPLAGRTRAAAPAAQPLVVTATLTGYHAAEITAVRPGPGRLPTAYQPSLHRLVVHGAGDAVLATVPVLEASMHRDDGGPSTHQLAAVAAVDPAQAQRVEIVDDAGVLGTRSRSAHAPQAAFLSPRRGQLVGEGRKLAIRWRASDADGDPLQVTVEWSALGGRPGTWRAVSVGRNGGRVALPSDYFAGSEDAFLRLRVSDGFNETVVQSAPFRTVHRGPRVTISRPLTGEHVRADATLSLTGVVRDERGQPLAARSVVWRDGRRVLGHGEGVAVRALSPGAHRLRLEAIDARGRRGADTVTVHVGAVAPSFTTLRAPARLAPGARRVVLRVASTIPARLTISGAALRARHAEVGEGTHAVAMRVRPGSGALVLRLKLSAAGRSTRTTVTVRRGPL